MNLCVGGFRLSKLVFNLSNENKWLEVAFTHITLIGLCLHAHKLCRKQLFWAHCYTVSFAPSC